MVCHFTSPFYFSSSFCSRSKHSFLLFLWPLAVVWSWDRGRIDGSKGMEGVNVVVNSKKLRRGRFGICEEGRQIFVSLLNMKTPFTTTESLDMVKVIYNIIEKFEWSIKVLDQSKPFNYFSYESSALKFWFCILNLIKSIYDQNFPFEDCIPHINWPLFFIRKINVVLKQALSVLTLNNFCWIFFRCRRYFCFYYMWYYDK